ncbi:MAG: CHAT domain-containing protein, partial [Candidatus Accumulibacter meliphilus]
ESYLDYPYGPNEMRAERVQTALRAWGQETFNTLLGQGQARDYYRDATRNGHGQLQLVIASDAPRVLSWPWEALHDPQLGDLAQHCRIERQLDTIADPLPLHKGLSRERVGILLVTARPYQGDVAYRSISRPLVELIHSEGLPAEVKVLRPPSFEQLRRELEEHRGAYHIVHFDGHGGFGQMGAGGADKFKGPQGQLVFEKDDGSQEAITGAQLSQLLREYRIPIAVLNACQSAMINEQADDAFASVATALLRAGVRSVVAMGYSLYVSGARQFLPAFYRQLFLTGSVADATRGGRQAMFLHPQRRGEIQLQDWLVPVLYQQDPLQLEFAKQPSTQQQALAPTPKPESKIPESARVEASGAPHGVIGRDSAVLELERASRRAPAALLLHGLGGVGKTTLARGYIEWLAHTQGLPGKVIWQSFADVRSFGYVRNRLVEEIFGTDAMALPDEKKWTALLQALRSQALLIVWDNFESASGAADAGVDSALPREERQALKQFLEQLRESKTKVLITSRSDEAWLGTTACYRIALGGLQGEERQALAQAILADQGLHLDAKDEDSAKLIDSLKGHPLMMRAILPRLGSINAKQLRQDFEQYVPQADSDDPVEQRLYATLRYIEEGLPADLKPLLYPIGLHEGYIYTTFLADMAKEAQLPFTTEQAQQALERLEVAGLVRRLGKNVYEMHPALARYARHQGARLLADAEDASAWEQGFVAIMAQLADHCAPKALHEQRPVFHIYGGSFERALGMAQRASDLQAYGALMQALANYALNRRDFPLAAMRFEAYARNCEQLGREDLAAAPYHQLGRVAQERRNLAMAEAWYCKALEIFERQGNVESAASCYHQLGTVAAERRKFETAENWYRKSLEIKEHQGNHQGAAMTYHQLGIVAHERRIFEAADAWYRKALEIFERQRDEHGAASTYQQLSRLAEERLNVEVVEEERNFEAAEAWCRKALEIFERQGNEHDAASCYGQLGNLALARPNLDMADAWYRKALAIFERRGNEHDTANSYHNLGRVAEARLDFDVAEVWYHKSMGIEERQDNEHGAAITYHRLGRVALAHKPPDLEAADAWNRKALEIFERHNDEHNAAISRDALQRLQQIAKCDDEGPAQTRASG